MGFGEAGLSGCGPLVLWFIKVCWVKAGMAWYGGLGWGKARQGCGEFGVRIGRAGYGRYVPISLGRLRLVRVR